MQRLSLVTIALFFASALASAESVSFQTWTGSYENGELTITSTVMIPKQETRTQEYTIRVPYAELITADGEEKRVTKYRTETRTREYAVVTHVAEKRTRVVKLESLDLQTVDGEKLPLEKLKKQFAKPTTVLQIPKGEALSATMKALLKEDTIVHVASAPTEKPLKTPPVPIASPPPKPIEAPKPIEPPAKSEPKPPSQSLQTWQGRLEGEKLVMDVVVQVPYVETSLQVYTVQVPVQKQLKKDDGTNTIITTLVTEQRTRTVPVTKYRQETRQKTIPAGAWQALNLQDFKGEKLTNEAIKKAFADGAIVLQFQTGRLSAEARSLLKESVILQEISAPIRGQAPVAPPTPIEK